ncbi:unnamed protein product [Amoebophrya sp. A120]|nr:unnamed protein product [Amoebophrya sp. A120]|eukprot:GSA120T00008895001.1
MATSPTGLLPENPNHAEQDGEHLSVEFLQTQLRHAEEQIKVEETELQLRKQAVFDQQKKLQIAQNERNALKEKLDRAVYATSPQSNPSGFVSLTALDQNGLAQEAQQFSMDGDTDEENDPNNRSGGHSLDGLDFDTPLDAIGVAKCGRCGARLPLDTEAIEAHTIECEQNFPSQPLRRNSQNNGTPTTPGGSQAFPSSSSSGPSSTTTHPGVTTSYSGVVRHSIINFFTSPDSVHNTAEPTDHGAFELWLRDFHREFSDDRFARNLPRLREAFLATWEESVEEIVESRRRSRMNGRGGTTNGTTSTNGTTGSKEQPPLEPPLQDRALVMSPKGGGRGSRSPSGRGRAADTAVASPTIQPPGAGPGGGTSPVQLR